MTQEPIPGNTKVFLCKCCRKLLEHLPLPQEAAAEPAVGMDVARKRRDS